LLYFHTVGHTQMGTETAFIENLHFEISKSEIVKEKKKRNNGVHFLAGSAYLAALTWPVPAVLFF